MSDWEYDDSQDMYFPDIGEMVRYKLGFVTSKLDEHPPFYPYNTFAQRENNCAACHKQIWGVGWYFRFIYASPFHFLCEACREWYDKALVNESTLSKRGIDLHGVLEEKLGKEIIEMLAKKALTN